MSELDISSVVERVVHGLRDELEIVCLESAKKRAPLVESEIELMILVTFDIVGRLSVLNIAIGSEFPEDINGPVLLVTPQFSWGEYRIDFCFRHTRAPDKFLFVECDGHDFHERTKEQAERDRAKDRAIQAAGIPILRFTGREIWRDPDIVALEIFNFLKGRLS
jgi:very-short-patch-repair endonuclease